ncbi:hypothetical protein [Pseudomonas virus PBPA162]|uniref:Uncharacterized protein n=1 Tax=Pseudomonas virus PBPA162 TaxID=2588096 RepID=A0A4Y5TNI5_9CAUD|nr:hypothetical protein PQC32_gp80 [Pseudomonas virus PBPA162]QDB70914.1 hypothetical protein [Pseudomonas virus PBPA162]
MSVNKQHMLSMLQSNYTTVRVVFEEVEAYKGTAPSMNANEHEMHSAPWAGAPMPPPMKGAGTGPQHAYSYKVDNDMGVQVNDVVVVPASGRLKLALVVQVDETPDIDLTVNWEYQWVAAKVDLSNFYAMLDKEKRFKTLMFEAERAKQRESMLNDIKALLPTEGEAGDLAREALGLFNHKLVVDGTTE